MLNMEEGRYQGENNRRGRPAEMSLLTFLTKKIREKRRSAEEGVALPAT